MKSMQAVGDRARASDLHLQSLQGLAHLHRSPEAEARSLGSPNPIYRAIKSLWIDGAPKMEQSRTEAGSSWTLRLAAHFEAGRISEADRCSGLF